MILKILLAGDGGQGIQLISDLLTQASFNNGFFVSQIPNYGLEQRGGVSLSFLIISDQEISYPKFTKPDILLVMSEQARIRMENYESGIMSYDINDFVEKLSDQKIEKVSYNIFFLGLITKLLQEKNILKTEQVFELLEKKLSKKANWELNQQAFQFGTL
ncbi:MAG: 2-oxoacid:acceptor oxidoreductase family protein [Candidatus Magasanikiibacteriota bacterium]